MKKNKACQGRPIATVTYQVIVVFRKVSVGVHMVVLGDFDIHHFDRDWLWISICCDLVWNETAITENKKGQKLKVNYNFVKSNLSKSIIMTSVLILMIYKRKPATSFFGIYSVHYQFIDHYLSTNVLSGWLHIGQGWLGHH